MKRLKRHDLTDAEWDRLASLLPEIHGRAGGGGITAW
jgi:transposase